MNRILALMVLQFAVAAMPLAAADSRIPLWETVEVRDETPTVENEPIEITTRERQIYITTSRPVEVCVYSILGQLITKRKISPGTVRLTLGSRGVYILKTDTATRRINL